MADQMDSREVKFLPPVKRYVNAIEWHLRLPLREKVRVMSDVSTSIAARHEAGESYEEIMKDMGTPRQVAERFNAAMGVSDKPSRWRFLFLALLVLLVVGVIVMVSYQQGTQAGVSLMEGVISSGFFVRSSTDMGVIGGADGPTAIFVAGTFPSFLGTLLYAPGALACALIAGYLLARRPTQWRAAFRISIAAMVLFWLRTGAEFVMLSLWGGTPINLLSSLAGSLVTPAFWLPVIALVISLMRKKRAKKEL